MYIVFCVCVVQFGLAIWRWNLAAQIHNILDRPPGWWWERLQVMTMLMMEEWRFIKMNMCRSILVWPSGGERSKVPEDHITPCAAHITQYTHLASHIISCALHIIHDFHIEQCSTVLGFALYLGHNTIYTLAHLHTCTALEQVLHFSNFQTSDLPHWANQRIAHGKQSKQKSR